MPTSCSLSLRIGGRFQTCGITVTRGGPDKNVYTPLSHPNSNPRIMGNFTSRTPNPIRVTDHTRKETITLSAGGSASSSGFKLNPLLFLARITRQQLVDHKPFRAPYLKCLHDLYDVDALPCLGKQLLLHIRPTKPTDSDIRDFFLYHWPEVLLRKPRDLGFKSPARVPPFDGAIHLSHGLALHLIEKVIPPVSGRS